MRTLGVNAAAFNGFYWKFGGFPNKFAGFEELMQVHLLDFNSPDLGKKCGALTNKCDGFGFRGKCGALTNKRYQYAMAVKDFKKFFKRREYPKPPKDKNQRAFVGGSWSDISEEDDEKTKDETCLVVEASNEVDNLGFNLLSVGQICDSKCKVIFFENDSEIVKDGKVISRGGRTGVRVGRGRRGRRPKEGNDERVDNLNGQRNDQGIGANGGVEGVNGNVEGPNRGAPDFSTIIAQQLQNLLPAMLAWVVNGNRVCCSYKEFLACNPKKYDGKGGVVVLTRWIEKIKNVQNMSGCSVDQKVKYTAGSFVGKALTWWNSQIRTLSWKVAVSMSWNDFKFMMI
nr:reverse transcriptase domain-containing protein [Tanacetum cinerariifolium]